jgi:hypothetical protein
VTRSLSVHMLRQTVSRAVLLLLLASPAAAQQRPLLTEDPETIGAGLMLLEGGFDLQRGIFFPVSGLEGNLLRLPTLGLSIGVSSIAEIQIDGGIYNRLNVTARRPAPFSDELDFTGDQTGTVEDLVVGAKIRLAAETPGRPSFGLRFATRLPNASKESGIGLDTTDFYASMLVGKTVESIRIVGNAGVGILTYPADRTGQNDVLTYGLSMARAVAQGVEIVGEINGRLDFREGDPPPGTETRGAFRFGGRFTNGPVRVDAGVIIGTTPRDPSFGFTTGLTWVFRGFTVP